MRFLRTTSSFLVLELTFRTAIIRDSAAKSVTTDATDATDASDATDANTTGEVLLCLWIWDSPAIFVALVVLCRLYRMFPN
jgi:hypothetical protein